AGGLTPAHGSWLERSCRPYRFVFVSVGGSRLIASRTPLAGGVRQLCLYATPEQRLCQAFPSPSPSSRKHLIYKNFLIYIGRA
ncbi:MAG: hypothetical protein NDI70_06565, partial [Pseudomonas sagittaria]|nr:hypothetical protein [Pseudomonas sagittaria]